MESRYKLELLGDNVVMHNSGVESLSTSGDKTHIHYDHERRRDVICK